MTFNEQETMRNIFSREFANEIKKISDEAINIKGKPKVNFKCLVLCLKVYIPSISPKLPPKIHKIKKDFSLILHLCNIALFLSTYIKINDSKFINKKYININFI